MSAVAYKGNWSSSTLSPQQQVPCQLPPTPLSPPTPPPPEPAALSPLQMPTTTLHYTERQPSCDTEMTESATLPSISLPPALPAESQTSDDIEILECSQPYVCPYKYHPVDDQWQRTTCANMGLIYIQSSKTTPGGLHVPLTAPTSVRSIRGDGNCFFRSLSYIITGCEEQHKSVRRAIVRHEVLWSPTPPVASWPQCRECCRVH